MKSSRVGVKQLIQYTQQLSYLVKLENAKFDGFAYKFDSWVKNSDGDIFAVKLRMRYTRHPIQYDLLDLVGKKKNVLSLLPREESEEIRDQAIKLMLSRQTQALPRKNSFKHKIIRLFSKKYREMKVITTDGEVSPKYALQKLFEDSSDEDKKIMEIAYYVGGNSDNANHHKV